MCDFIIMDSLTASEKETIGKFREEIKDVLRKDHDDYSLYKWLKARSFNLKKAEAMYRKSMAWRAEAGADTILQTYTVPMVMTKYYPGGLCGRDREGRPLWIDPLGAADLRGIMYSVKKTDILKTMVYRMEELYEVFRQYTKEQRKQIDQCVHIIDMKGFGSNLMWKPALDLYIEILQLLENNYPETLKSTYFVNAPKIFQIGYNVLKKFIDKDTAKKFQFLDSNWKATLATVMDVDTIPEHYGGKLRDENGDPKCSTQVCYGGEVPKEHYRKKEEFFPSTKETVTLGRAGTMILAYHIPNKQHFLRYVFTVDSADVEFSAYLDPDADVTVVTAGSQALKGRLDDVSKMSVVQATNKYECHRVPEDGMLFFPGPGVCYLQFRNPSRLWRRTLEYVIEIGHVDENDRIQAVTNPESMSLVTEDTSL